MLSPLHGDENITQNGIRILRQFLPESSRKEGDRRESKPEKKGKGNRGLADLEENDTGSKKEGGARYKGVIWKGGVPLILSTPPWGRPKSQMGPGPAKRSISSQAWSGKVAAGAPAPANSKLLGMTAQRGKGNRMGQLRRTTRRTQGRRPRTSAQQASRHKDALWTLHRGCTRTCF